MTRLCAGVLAAILPLACAPAWAGSPASFCARAGTDDTLRPVPRDLAPAINALFGTRMPAEAVAATTVFRCADGHALVCTAGANLPCGKANASTAPTTGTAQWCRAHPGAASVPAFATGHDTLYAWQCRGRSPRVVRQVLAVDARGFVAQYWKALP